MFLTPGEFSTKSNEVYRSSENILHLPCGVFDESFHPYTYKANKSKCFIFFIVITFIFMFFYCIRILSNVYLFTCLHVDFWYLCLLAFSFEFHINISIPFK